MKKRVKLLTTIASLCLAVALMAFGVYAATTASFKVTSNISFTASSADVSWTLRTELDSKYSTAQDITNKTGDDAILLPITLSGTEAQGEVIAEYTFICTNNSEKSTVATVTFALSGKDAAKFEVSCTKDNADYESGTTGATISTLGTNSVTYVVTLKIVDATDTRLNYEAALTIEGQA